MSASTTNNSAQSEEVATKGKGKAADGGHDVEMDEDDESGEEESGVDEQVEEEEEDEDNMEEIDMDNIVEGGRRTRGKVIDFAKAAANDKDLEDDEDDDDEDFEAPDEEMEG